MNKLLLQFIKIIHYLFILFIVIAPFINNNEILLIHATTVPFLYLHWITNDNTCALTILETNVQKKIYGHSNENDCFTCNIINPIYGIHTTNKSISKYIYIITFIFWCVSVSKLYKKYINCEISNSFIDLCRVCIKKYI